MLPVLKLAAAPTVQTPDGFAALIYACSPAIAFRDDKEIHELFPKHIADDVGKVVNVPPTAAKEDPLVVNHGAIFAVTSGTTR